MEIFIFILIVEEMLKAARNDRQDNSSSPLEGERGVVGKISFSLSSINLCSVN